MSSVNAKIQIRDKDLNFFPRLDIEFTFRSGFLLGQFLEKHLPLELKVGIGH